MNRPIDIPGIELLAHRTWPCRTQERLGDWILRERSGFTRRANSCLALGNPGLPHPCAVDRVEAWYRSREVEPCIKICTGAPEGLDDVLAGKDWTVATPTRVLGFRGSSEAEIASGFAVESHPSEEWLEHVSRWDGESSEKASHHADLARSIPRAGFASWNVDGEIVAVALAALEPEVCHLYDLVVREDRRGQGIGRRFTNALLTWSRTQGAGATYLQVMESNTVARGLYASLGFVEHHRYHYRVAPSSGTPTCGC